MHVKIWGHTPWLEIQIASAPFAIASSASSAVIMPWHVCISAAAACLKIENIQRSLLPQYSQKVFHTRSNRQQPHIDLPSPQWKAEWFSVATKQDKQAKSHHFSAAHGWRRLRNSTGYKRAEITLRSSQLRVLSNAQWVAMNFDKKPWKTNIWDDWTNQVQGEQWLWSS